ncbi:anti-sigma factor [Pseudomonas sp. HK3]
MINPDDQNALALEYVLGTLRGEERKAFAKQLPTNDSLKEAVHYWENILMPAPDSVPLLAPKASTLKKIQAAINPANSAKKEKPISIWEKLLPWKIITSAAFAMLLVVSGVLLNNTLNPEVHHNTDYVAILVDDSDNPILTALTTRHNGTLWLKWEKWQSMDNHSMQLWAKSRRDGQIRPLLVFGNNKLKHIVLDEATLRLIHDSSHLIITQEEVGGSSLDEPSDIIIAKGVCIRLAETKDSA